MPSVYLQLKNIKQAWRKRVNTEGVRARLFEWIVPLLIRPLAVTYLVLDGIIIIFCFEGIYMQKLSSLESNKTVWCE